MKTAIDYINQSNVYRPNEPKSLTIENSLEESSYQFGYLFLGSLAATGGFEWLDSPQVLQETTVLIAGSSITSAVLCAAGAATIRIVNELKK